MTKARTKTAAIPAKSSFTSAPTPPDRPSDTKGVRLANSEDIRREMRSVYVECRRNKLVVEKGCKLAYMLGLILKAHEAAELEARIAKLEAAYAKA